MANLFTLFISAVLINNVILSQFLGVCPFLGVSKNKSSAIGMGAAVTFVIFGASILTYGLYKLVLEPNSLEYMDLLSFILIIASFVQFVEMFIKKFSPALYKSLGIYLPLLDLSADDIAVSFHVALPLCPKKEALRPISVLPPEKREKAAGAPPISVFRHHSRP